MTIRYRNSFRDVMAFCFYHYPRSAVVVGSYGIIIVLLSILIFQALPEDVSAVARLLTFILMEGILFTLLGGLFALSVVLSMVSRRNKTFLTEHTITLGQGGFITETIYSKSEQKWTIVQRLARSSAYLFIYVSQHGAHVIPRRAFRDAAEWEAFYEYCRQRTEIP